MLENTGLDLRFASDIHSIATSLKKIADIQQLALAKIANDLGSLFCEKQAQQKLTFLQNFISGCDETLWAEAQKQMNLVFENEDPFEKEEDDEQ